MKTGNTDSRDLDERNIISKNYTNLQLLPILLNSHNLGKLSHSIIITGSDQEKNKNSAIEFATAILGIEISENLHPDIYLVDGLHKNEINVDEIRQINKFLQKSSYSSKYKIVIIDYAERMNPNAYNSLLKIFEEPTKNTYLFLITSRKDYLPATIISRAVILKGESFAPKSLDNNRDFVNSLDSKKISEILININSSKSDQTYISSIFYTLLNLIYNACLPDDNFSTDNNNSKLTSALRKKFNFEELNELYNFINKSYFNYLKLGMDARPIIIQALAKLGYFYER